MGLSEPRKTQLKAEIDWLRNKISVLELDLKKRPRRQREINTYLHQIKQKEYEIALGIE